MKKFLITLWITVFAILGIAYADSRNYSYHPYYSNHPYKEYDPYDRASWARYNRYDPSDYRYYDYYDRYYPSNYHYNTNYYYNGRTYYPSRRYYDLNDDVYDSYNPFYDYEYDRTVGND